MASEAHCMFAATYQTCVFVCSGLVSEPTLQRKAHEAAERSGRTATRVFPEPAEDEDARGPTGARGAHPQRAFLLLWRYDSFILFKI